MDLADVRPDQWVTYRAHPAAAPEDGDVVRVGGNGLVFVLFRGDRTAKACRPEDLSPGQPHVHTPADPRRELGRATECTACGLTYSSGDFSTPVHDALIRELP